MTIFDTWLTMHARIYSYGEIHFFKFEKWEHGGHKMLICYMMLGGVITVLQKLIAIKMYLPLKNSQLLVLKVVGFIELQFYFIIHHLIFESVTERKYSKNDVEINVLKTLKEITNKCESLLDFEFKVVEYYVILIEAKEEVKHT